MPFGCLKTPTTHQAALQYRFQETRIVWGSEIGGRRCLHRKTKSNKDVKEEIPSDFLSVRKPDMTAAPETLVRFIVALPNERTCRISRKDLAQLAHALNLQPEKATIAELVAMIWGSGIIRHE